MAVISIVWFTYKYNFWICDDVNELVIKNYSCLSIIAIFIQFIDENLWFEWDFS